MPAARYYASLIPTILPFMSKSFRLMALLSIVWGALALSLVAQTYSYSTLAGVAGAGPSVLTGTGGTASPTLFNQPEGLVITSSGNLIVADTTNSVLRMVTPGGVVTTFSGIPGAPGVTDGTAGVAQFFRPQNPAIDTNGNIYVADYGAHTIRKVTPTGTVTTFAGSPGTNGNADGTGTAATFSGPQAIAIDSSGNLYVANTLGHTIRKITSAGVVTTLAGTAGTSGTADGTGTAALFNAPSGIAVDSGGNVYVADTLSHTIRKITSAGVVTTLAGKAGLQNYVDAGSGTDARFANPIGLSVTAAGNILVADYTNNVIRQVTPGGSVTTVAGSRGSSAGRVDGASADARFFHPTAAVSDFSGNIYVTDYSNHLLRKIAPDGTVTTLAGAGGAAGFQNGIGYIVAPALFSAALGGIALDGDGNAYVADGDNRVIRKITPAGVTTNWVGRVGVSGSLDGTGDLALFSLPVGLARASDGTFYATDNGTIRKITAAGVVTTLAGTVGLTGTTDAQGAAARFFSPRGVAVANGVVYVADTANNLIRKITADGVVTTIAGKTTDGFGVAGSADGTGTAATFSSPTALVFDSSGNLFIADSDNNTIRKMTPAGVVSTFAGTAGVIGRQDGTGTGARFNQPSGLAIDAQNNLYVTDWGNHAIRLVTPAGVVTTIGGAGGGPGTVDGPANEARFDLPYGIAVSPSGSIYFTLVGSHTVVVGTPSSNPGSGPTTVTKTYTSDSAPGGNLFPGDIWRKTQNGQVIDTYRWDGTQWVDTANTGFNAGGSGSPTVFLSPSGIAIDSAGNLYIADTGNHSIKKVTSAGVATVLAGSDGSVGTADGAGTAARFNSPAGVAVDSGGIVYVADTGNGTIRKIATDGTVSTFAGSPSSRGDANGTGSAALFRTPTGIAVNSSNEIYVADSTSRTIRKITINADVSTVTGTALTAGDANGPAARALYSSPTGLAISGTAPIYIADTNNQTIRFIDSAGVVDTLAGLSGVSGAGDGTNYDAYFNLPQGLYFAANSNLYVADTANSTIRRVTSPGYVVTIAGLPGISGYRNSAAGVPLFNQPKGLVVDNNSGTVFVLDTGNSVIRKIATDGTVTTLALTAGSTGGGGGGGGGDSGGGGGGGAPSVWFVAVLSALGAARLLGRRSAR
jgi:hypothetical protein